MILLTAAVAVATIAALWPDAGRVASVRADAAVVGTGVTFPQALVDRTFPVCPGAEGGVVPTTTPGGEPCNLVRIQVVEGEADGTLATIGVPPHVAAVLERDDTIRVVMVPAHDDAPATYTYFGTERPEPVWVLAAVLTLLLLLLARLRGLLSLLALAGCGLLLGLFLLPAVLAGESALPVGLAATAAMLIAALYAAHGVSPRTNAALLGALVGLATAGLAGWLGVSAARLTGVTDQRSVLSGLAAPDLPGLVACGILVAGVGALVDVATKQAASVWHHRAGKPQAGRRVLFLAALRSGRGHLLSTVQTIAFAYAGTALVALLALEVYALPVLDLVSTEQLGAAVVSGLATGLGLALAMPAATAVAAFVVEGPRPSEPAGVARPGQA